ncbi:hypothetical protein [Geoglobus acetivorans]|uniref:Uncharacterized protein n=1 Tax=Geoglobus acetivorans TaxID=565033 RepID=A0A0A7GGX6_GEOAI|nr:hypothetical protein GACE_1159 [Geoglobus acetivorans]
MTSTAFLFWHEHGFWCKHSEKDEQGFILCRRVHKVCFPAICPRIEEFEVMDDD